MGGRNVRHEIGQLTGRLSPILLRLRGVSLIERIHPELSNPTASRPTLPDHLLRNDQSSASMWQRTPHRKLHMDAVSLRKEEQNLTYRSYAGKSEKCMNISEI
jgi:hypothetical protein